MVAPCVLSPVMLVWGLQVSCAWTALSNSMAWGLGCQLCPALGPGAPCGWTGLSSGLPFFLLCSPGCSPVCFSPSTCWAGAFGLRVEASLRGHLCFAYVLLCHLGFGPGGCWETPRGRVHSWVCLAGQVGGQVFPRSPGGSGAGTADSLSAARVRGPFFSAPVSKKTARDF